GGALLSAAQPNEEESGVDTKIGYVFSDGQMPVVTAAHRSLLLERPDLADRLEFRFLTESLFDDEATEEIADVDVLVFDVMNQQLVDRFREERGIDLVARVGGRSGVIGVGEGLLPREHYVDRGVVWDARARAFWAGSGPTNQLGLMKLALDRAGVEGLTLPEPEGALDFGYYYPDQDGGRIFETWDEFVRFRRAAGGLRADAERIAVAFYRATYYGGDKAVLDSVIEEIERQGAEAIPLFGYPAHVALERLLLDEEGRRRADAGLSFLFRFAQPDSSATLDEIDIPILNLATLYGRSAKQWRTSATGLSVFEGTFQVAAPEFAGLLAPTVVGSRERVFDDATGLSVVVSRPIEERVAMAVRRARRWIHLARKGNEEKRLGLVYYNYPPGKAGVGASYLNVAQSLSEILERLAAEGYDLGARSRDPESVLQALLAEGRNVASVAPGELVELLAAGDAVKIPLDRYRRWLDELPGPLRREVLDDWEDPGGARLMRSAAGDFIVPVVRYGNVAVLPQPARGWGEDLEALYHAEDLAPHHQYVAAYEWLRRDWQADAVVHIGTHGTLEWLDGKAAGLAEEDAPDALIADVPHLYVYNVDVVGEGLVARRRSAAALVDHMVPPFRESGLYAELAELSERIDDHDINLSKNPMLATRYAQEIYEQVVELGIAKDLGLEVAERETLSHRQIHAIERYLAELASENIPYGLHTFGRAPAPVARASTVQAIVSVDRSLLPDARSVLADTMDRRIRDSAPLELARLVEGLEGGYLPGGNGGEPIRNPDVYPTGKNFYGINPDKIPKKAAYELGVKMADELLTSHFDEHGEYPEKVSFVIWGDETMRHEGIVESQVFHLLGTRPVWDARGNVRDVEVLPREELGRPRIDVVIASAAEGMFYNVTQLMDRAVQKVKVLEEADNLVRRHVLATRQALLDKGYSEEQAERQASVRIFDEAPGVFNLNTSRIVEASGSWDTDAGIANDYLKKMGHGYGNGFWGEPMEDAFRLALAGTEAIVHSSSTMLYGALDNDDFYMYAGGLATAVRSLDGETPEIHVTNSRNPGKPEMTAIDEFVGKEFKARYVNPRWLEGMMKEGYAGAGEMRAFVEYLWGWDATAGDVVGDAMWSEVFEVYVEDKHAMGLGAFFDEASPFAYQDMTARMLETVRKDYWQAEETVRDRLLREYLESVDEHGISCVAHTCANPRFLDYVERTARETGVPSPLVDSFVSALQEAVQGDQETRLTQMEAFVHSNEQRIERRQQLARAGRVPSDVAGYLMSEVQRELTGERRSAASGPVGTLFVGFALLVTLFAWRRARS
ncbi:MAG: cobaltochelatase subunit CobN, partial [Acidobacteriota bacterium]